MLLNVDLRDERFKEDLIRHPLGQHTTIMETIITMEIIMQ